MYQTHLFESLNSQLAQKNPVVLSFPSYKIKITPFHLPLIFFSNQISSITDRLPRISKSVICNTLLYQSVLKLPAEVSFCFSMNVIMYHPILPQLHILQYKHHENLSNFLGFSYKDTRGKNAIGKKFS